MAGLPQAGERQNQKRDSQLLLRPQSSVCLVACEKNPQSSKQSWFSLVYLACCAFASAKSILQSPWSRGSPIAGAAEGLEPLFSGIRQPTAPAPLHSGHAPTHTHSMGHCCSACMAGVQLLSPKALEDATCLGTSVGFSHLKPQSWQVKARGVTPSLAMKWQAHKAHRSLAAHSSHVDLAPDLGALDDLLVPLWLQAHRAVAPGTSSAQHTKLLLAQADTGNYGVTPPAQSREFH